MLASRAVASRAEIAVAIRAGWGQAPTSSRAEGDRLRRCVCDRGPAMVPSASGGVILSIRKSARLVLPLLSCDYIYVWWLELTNSTRTQ